MKRLFILPLVAFAITIIISSVGCSFQKSEHTLTSDTLFLAQFYKEYLSNLNQIDREKFLMDRVNELDSVFYIQFKQPINGYTVKVMCFRYSAYDKERDNEIWGNALLCFEKDDYHRFYIYNESFSDSILYYINEEPIKDGLVLDLDYLPKQENEYLSQNSPFFFQDLDFDGTEELVINNWRQSIRHCNTYDVYKIDGTSAELITTPPFYKISNYMTEFDSINKTITTTHGTDINGNIVFQTYHIGKQYNQHHQTDNHVLEK